MHGSEIKPMWHHTYYFGQRNQEKFENFIQSEFNATVSGENPTNNVIYIVVIIYEHCTVARICQ